MFSEEGKAYIKGSWDFWKAKQLVNAEQIPGRYN